MEIGFGTLGDNPPDLHSGATKTDAQRHIENRRGSRRRGGSEIQRVLLGEHHFNY